MLSLKKALKENKLEQFIKQETARGVGPASVKQYDRLVEELITAPLPEDQTSHSRDGDD